MCIYYDIDNVMRDLLIWPSQILRHLLAWAVRRVFLLSGSDKKDRVYNICTFSVAQGSRQWILHCRPFGMGVIHLCDGSQSALCTNFHIEADGACWLPLPLSFSMVPVATDLSGSGNPAAGEDRGPGGISIPGQSV